MTKTIVITGAGSGLGRAMARRLAQDGHRLVLLGRTPARLEAVAQEIGNGARALACDVADAQSVKDAFAGIARAEPHIDVLINNAAVYEPFLIEEATEEQITAAIQTNLTGAIHCSRAALPQMARGGHIIAISSRTVVEPAVMLGLYQTSKAGLERFTRTLREEVAERGIRVTMLRAAGMMEEGMNWTVSPEVGRRFQEARRKRGIDRGNNPVSQFASVAQLLPWLIGLPADVDVTELMLEARHP
ncbi:MAG: SDR family oxidoreductase [Novosphingobium sp.]|nr:SDR family oxidoreductase [Novosphingobium sp.]